jgi:hypothetical protein
MGPPDPSSDQHPFGLWAGLSSAAGRSLVFAALSAAAVAVRIVERGEGFQPRTLLLLATVAAGACLAGAILFGVASIVARGWPAVVRGTVATPLLAAAFTGFTVLIFAILRHTADAAFDAEDHHAFAWIGLVEDSLGLFLTIGARYWLPWPLPLIGLIGGFLAALPFRTRMEAAAALNAAARPCALSRRRRSVTALAQRETTL